MRRGRLPQELSYQADPFLDSIRAKYAPEGFKIAAETPYNPKVITAAEARQKLDNKRERFRHIARRQVIPLAMNKINLAILNEMDQLVFTVPFNLTPFEKREDREMVVGYTIEELRRYGYYVQRDPGQFDKLLISFRPMALK